jgi:Spy/CpxP family protein refolding chaperone
MRIILLLVLFTVAFALPAFSQMDMPMMAHMEGHDRPLEMGGMDRMGDMMGMCLENAVKIGLSDEQIRILTPLHREMHKKQVRYKADLKIAEMELMEIMEVKDFDIEKANAGVKKIADIKTAHHLEMLKSMKEVRTVLTDEQFKKMKKLMPMKLGGKKPIRKMMKK